MLVSLEIKNFLLIKNISINFSNGFNTFTGETGAGKSIIIDGLKLALGGKNKSDLNLKDGEVANIKAVFDITSNIKKKLEILNIQIEDDYLILDRQIDSRQKSKILLNGQLQPLSIIKELLNKSVEFQENYEQQELFDNKYFLDFIDKLGQINTDNCKETFENYKQYKKDYLQLVESEKDKKEKLEILKNKLNKINLLNPKENEYLKLLEQRNFNKNYKKISDISAELKKTIDLINNNGDLLNVDKNLSKLSEFDNSFLDLSNKFSSNYIEINEIINEIEYKFEKFQFDENNFEDIEDKIYQYQQLSNFFEVEPTELYSIKEKLINEIDVLENFEKEKKKLYDKYCNSLLIFKKEAEKISKQREKNAKEISNRINKLLPEMNIEQGEISFELEIVDESDYSKKGIDNLNVLFRTNKKNDFSSIKKVASGGELSRLLLIVKSLSASFDKDLTVVFDEVDSGLSGRIANNVATKIYELSKSNQIIAITHSAQVASKANQHWKIEKKIEKDDMQSQIYELDTDSRILELATLISGSKITEESKKVAIDLLGKTNEK